MGKGEKKSVHMVWPDVCMRKCPHAKLMRDPSKVHKYNKMMNFLGHTSGRFLVLFERKCLYPTLNVDIKVLLYGFCCLRFVKSLNPCILLLHILFLHFQRDVLCLNK